jgi:hypothetical protein
MTDQSRTDRTDLRLSDVCIAPSRAQANGTLGEIRPICLARLSHAARRLFALRRDACCWPSNHDLEDARFSWCGEAACSGRSYCAAHDVAAHDVTSCIDLPQPANRRAGTARGITQPPAMKGTDPR